MRNKRSPAFQISPEKAFRFLAQVMVGANRLSIGCANAMELWRTCGTTWIIFSHRQRAAM
jgi:hypothetical protein